MKKMKIMFNLLNRKCLHSRIALHEMLLMHVSIMANCKETSAN